MIYRLRSRLHVERSLVSLLSIWTPQLGSEPRKFSLIDECSITELPETSGVHYRQEACRTVPNNIEHSMLVQFAYKQRVGVANRWWRINIVHLKPESSKFDSLLKCLPSQLITLAKTCWSILAGRNSCLSYGPYHKQVCYAVKCNVLSTTCEVR